MTAFLRQTRGELRKLINPVTVGLLVVAVVFLWHDLSRTNYLASDQPQIAVTATLGTRQQAVDVCSGDQTDTVKCKRARSNAADNATFGREGLALGAIAASLGTFPGLARFVSHQFMTGLGWLFVAMLAAMHVTRDEAQGTAARRSCAPGAAASWRPRP